MGRRRANTAQPLLPWAGAIKTTQSAHLVEAAERDRMMLAVEEKANLLAPEFSERAAAYIPVHLRKAGPTSSEELTRACKRAGIIPHDDRAFGPVYMRLSRAGRIRIVGNAKRTRGHLTAGGHVWALVSEEHTP